MIFSEIKIKSYSRESASVGFFFFFLYIIFNFFTLNLEKKKYNLFQKKHYYVLHGCEKLFIFVTRNHKINIK